MDELEQVQEEQMEQQNQETQPAQPERAKTLEAEELSAFALRIAMMLKAGIPLSEGVSLMAEESVQKEERALLDAIYQKIEQEGCPFYEALQQLGGFPNYFVKLVEIGELAGRLEQVTEALAAHYRREAALQNSIRQTISYPVAMALVMAGVVFVILTQVLPMFESAYRELGRSLTATAAMLISIGRVAENFGTVLAVLLVAIAAAGFYLLYTRAGRRRFALITERRMAKGKMGVKLSTSRFASGMSLMLSSGVDIDTAVQQSLELVPNPAVKAQVEECMQRMEQGESFTMASARVGLFVGLDAGLLSSGFQSGNSEVAMQEIADRLSDDVNDRLEQAVGRIEPVLVAVLSGVVGLVLMSVMLPLISVLSTVG